MRGVVASLLGIVLAGLGLAVASGPALGQAEKTPAIETRTDGMVRLEGFLPLYWDERDGRLWLEIARFDEELLYYTSLPAGIGSNDIGLDRGRLGTQHLVVFRRVGPRVLMVEPNYAFRATSENPAERRAVDDAFARSVLWGFAVAAETDGRVLVDATDFVLRDAVDVRGTLRRTDGGRYRLDASRSAVHLPRTKAFPRNTEIEATTTFVTDSATTGWVRDVTPTAEAVTVRQHHSFIELPDPYRPRRWDPRAGYFGISYLDYAVPLGEPMRRRFVSRHRLEKRDPAAPRSEPVEPIVYYVDPGTPEPIRSALVEGAAWWNEAFEAAGYRDAFRVEPLPPDADPMDVRYNVIQWVHRATRGWSYGSTVEDPRTGEILKGHVILGSLRVRQDYLIAEGLLSPYDEGSETPSQLAAMALARIRQLSAHEVGHTLGLAHNYIASGQGPEGRASVMDYPHPLVTLRGDGSLDVSRAYDDGVGEWDKVAIAYGYQHFPAGTDVDAALTGILSAAREGGITFVSDQDARPPGSAHPAVHLWDNGADAVAELDRVMDVRRAALSRLGERTIKRAAPLATIEEALVPIYLFHRYQTEAAVKVLGGVSYGYAMRGDGQPPPQRVPAAAQRRAMQALLRTLEPAELIIPRAVLDRLPPRPYGLSLHRELFDRYTGLVFDAVAPAAAAADHTLSLLLHPERAARLVEQEAVDPSLPGLDEVIDELTAFAFGSSQASFYEAEVSRAVEWLVVTHLTTLARTAPMPQVRAIASFKLGEVAAWLAEQEAEVEDAAHYAALRRDIDRFLERPLAPVSTPAPVAAPPGSPIGGG